MKKISALFVALTAVLGLSAKTLYLQPNDDWKTAGARFAIYAFDESQNPKLEAWYSMSAVEGNDGYYQATVDENYPKVIFCRMKGDAAENNWSNKWNQTQDMTIEAEKDLCVISGWDNAGAWSKYGSSDPTPGDTKYYLKNCWNGASEWTWKEMAKDGDNYKLERVVFGGGGVNYNTKESDTGATWVEAKDFQGDKVAALDTVTFALNPATGKITATLLGKYATTGDVKYYMKNGWNGGAWTWKEMTKDGEKYKLENVVFGGTGVNYNTVQVDQDAKWVPVADFKGDKVDAKDTVTFVLDPAKEEVTATLVGKYVTPGYPDVKIAGDFNEWTATALTPALDKKSGSIKVNLPKAQSWGFKIIVEGKWLAAGDKGVDYKRGDAALALKYDQGEGNNVFIIADVAGEYTITWNYADSTVLVAFPELPEVTLADGYYVIGLTGWSIYALDANLKMEANEGAEEAEYVLKNVVLTEGQEMKVVEVKDKALGAWFGMKDDANYKITADVAGTRDIYFRPTYNEAWEGHIYVNWQPTAIDEVNGETKAVKVMENGQLFIIKNGVHYNVLGTVVR